MASNKSFKSIKINMFFFFLLLSIIFWALTKFSKENTASISATIEYQNLPDNYLLGDQNPEKIDFYITTNGIDFLIYKMKQPTVVFDVSKYFNTETRVAAVSAEELKEEIAKQIGYSGVVRNISEKGLPIKMQGIQTKKVPVIIKATLSYSEGFRPLNTIRAIPDSIVVTGPSRFLDSISEIATQEVFLENLSSNVSEEVALLPFPFEGMAISTTNVRVEQTVKEFAQKKLSLPITIENVPEDTVIKLIPKRVTVTSLIPIEKFSAITENDFKVVCDFSEKNSEENFLSLKLVSFPAFAENIELLPKKIDFLIFKK